MVESIFAFFAVVFLLLLAYVRAMTAKYGETWPKRKRKKNCIGTWCN